MLRQEAWRVRKAISAGMLCLVVGVGGTSGQGSPSAIEAAAARLAKTPIFAMGGVGFAGATSEGERDFRTIMANHPPPEVFAALYEQGNSQGKAYALLGLQQLKSTRFQEIASSLSKSDQELALMQGCIMSREKLSSIAKRIDAGEF